MNWPTSEQPVYAPGYVIDLLRESTDPQLAYYRGLLEANAIQPFVDLNAPRLELRAPCPLAVTA